MGEGPCKVHAGAGLWRLIRNQNASEKSTNRYAESSWGGNFFYCYSLRGLFLVFFFLRRRVRRKKRNPEPPLFSFFPFLSPPPGAVG